MASIRSCALALIRQKLENYTGKVPLHSYLIPMTDAHDSEYPSAADKRIGFITGFTGSYGTAVITLSEAHLWTDSRYHEQAERQLSDDWQLHRLGNTDVIPVDAWLDINVPANCGVGVDASLLTHSRFQQINKSLMWKDKCMVQVSTNWVDEVWEGKPDFPNKPIFPVPSVYVGAENSWVNKLRQMAAAVRRQGADYLVISALDEIAWLFNLRGSDIEHNPVFFSYCIVSLNDVTLFVNASRVGEVADLLRCSDSGDYQEKFALSVEPYANVYKMLSTLEANGSKVWFSDSCNHQLVSTITESRALVKESPAKSLKGIKNAVEQGAMKRAHILDAVALCRYFAWLDAELEAGGVVTEFTGANKLDAMRAEMEDYVSLSFETTSASGPNASLAHYTVEADSARPLSLNEMYLVDSGAQYSCGTTDITRTVHFGTPTAYDRECFTRVLKGVIALTSVVMPYGENGATLDGFARRYLWEAGLDYGHGTGHGVGCFLNVHEEPYPFYSVRVGGRCAMMPGYIFTIEPGYYEAGRLGIRIENVVQVVPHRFEEHSERRFVRFEPLSWVPLQTKLMQIDMMTPGEIDWVNDYNRKCLKLIGPELLSRGFTQANAWLTRECVIIA